MCALFRLCVCLTVTFCRFDKVGTEFDERLTVINDLRGADRGGGEAGLGVDLKEIEPFRPALAVVIAEIAAR